MGDERLEIREDILKAVTSPEAERATRQLPLIYLRLVRAPPHLWEGEHVLRLTGDTREGQRISAWDQLITLVGVSPRIMRRAVAWLHGKGIIEYHTTQDRSEIVITFDGLANRESKR